MSKRPRVMKAGEGEALSVMGSKVSFLCRGDDTDHSWSLMEVVLPKDVGPPPHDHAWDEGYYVVAGQVRFTLEGNERVLGPGDFVYAPGGTLHGFAGASEQPARMVIFDAPAHAEGFFRDAEREVRNIPADLAKVPGIGARHKIRFVAKH